MADIKKKLLQICSIRDFQRTQICELIWENPTIGILLCADKNDAVVRCTLSEDEKQIFASNYKLYLPTEAEIFAKIKSEQEKLKFLKTE